MLLFCDQPCGLCLYIWEISTFAAIETDPKRGPPGLGDVLGSHHQRIMAFGRLLLFEGSKIFCCFNKLGACGGHFW